MGAEEGGVLAVRRGDLADFGETEFLTLVEVGRAGEGQHQQGRGPGPAQTAGDVDLGGVAAAQEPCLVRAADQHVAGAGRRGRGQAVAGGVAGDVVVGEDPGRGGARPGGECQVVRDDPAELRCVEISLEQVEVERLAQPVGAGVPGQAVGLDPGFGDGRTGRGVLVEDGAPFGVDLVDLVAVPDRVLAVLEGVEAVDDRPERIEGGIHVLGQPMGHVDPESVRAAVRPEAQGRQEVVADVAAVPVEIGLFLGEKVQVPLAGCPVGFGDPLPGRAAEDRGPPVGRELAVLALAVAEDVAPPRRGSSGGGEGFPEPRMEVGGVIRDDVHHDLQAGAVQGRDHLVELLQSADPRVDVAVVGDVVAAVGQGGGVEGAQPDGVDPQLLEVVDPGDDASEVTDAVAVGVGEAAGIDLVDGRLAPPVGVRGVRVRDSRGACRDGGGGSGVRGRHGWVLRERDVDGVTVVLVVATPGTLLPSNKSTG
ncbi:hypothetical protein SDC9_83227 [bioreactor metagenome]|uniref:Uncharacterized protein n=1 Tax=bioreactor metagenome TaxID=1076179 RepID=A0A644Z8L6_9ZZZZ